MNNDCDNCKKLNRENHNLKELLGLLDPPIKCYAELVRPGKSQPYCGRGHYLVSQWHEVTCIHCIGERLINDELTRAEKILNVFRKWQDNINSYTPDYIYNEIKSMNLDTDILSPWTKCVNCPDLEQKHILSDGQCLDCDCVGFVPLVED